MDDVAEAIEQVYNVSKEDRKVAGLKGREHFINEAGLTHTNMCQQLENGIESVFENWKPRERFEVFRIK